MGPPVRNSAQLLGSPLGSARLLRPTGRYLFSTVFLSQYTPPIHNEAPRSAPLPLSLQTARGRRDVNTPSTLQTDVQASSMGCPEAACFLSFYSTSAIPTGIKNICSPAIMVKWID